MKKSLFREGHHYFHINIDFTVHPIFKELDWIFVQHKISQLLRDYSVQLHALVMMDTHLHILILSDLRKENFFCEHLVLLLNISSRPLECHCEPVPTFAHYLGAYKYIYRNPAEAGLILRVEDYPYSSLGILLGRSVAHCEIIDHLGLIQNPLQQLNWLNDKQDYKFSKLSQFEEKTRTKS